MNLRLRAVSTLLFAFVAAGLVRVPEAAAHDPAEDMVVMAKRFLSTLDEEQKAKAALPWKSDKRTFWHFVPDFAIKPDGVRPGLPITEMTAQQRLFAQGLLTTALTHQGLQQAATIQALEKVLFEIEGRDIRDAELYYVTVFGKPSLKETWAWRFEGHHLSINVTLVKGKLFSVTPSFFGSNPHVVQSGPLKGTKVLADEEDLARKLVQSLDAKQRKQAILAAEAPADILTSQDRKVDRGVFFPPKGVAFSDLNDDQQELLLKLVDVYVGDKYRAEIVEQVDGRTKIKDTKSMHFAWAGPTDEGGHYYRVQTETFLFEYDCTQNDANHVHAVWRHFDGDFGEDLLRKHYEEAHGAK